MFWKKVDSITKIWDSLEFSAYISKQKKKWGGDSFSQSRALGLIKDEGYFLKFQARLKTIESKKLCYIFD